MPVVNVILVRHAETSNNNLQMSGQQLTTATRISDVQITRLGQNQSELTSSYLSKIDNVSHVLISPMLRTLQTAKPLVDNLGNSIKTEIWLDLFEEGGIFNGTRADHLQGKPHESLQHGLTIDEIKNHLGTDVSVIGEVHNSRGWWKGGFETPPESLSRADTVADRIWDLVKTFDKPATIVIVTHGLFMDSVVRKFLSFPTNRETVPFFALNCGFHILHLHTETGRVAVACLNGTPHLPADLRTGHSIGDIFRCSRDYLSS
jgi:broad specificity phosphatase PhoE